MVQIETLDDGVLIFTFTLPNGIIEGIADLRLINHKLYLDQLHLQGAMMNQIGRAALWQCARELGLLFQAHTVVIQGGRRTTGKTKGQIPAPVIIKVAIP